MCSFVSPGRKAFKTHIENSHPDVQQKILNGKWNQSTPAKSNSDHKISESNVASQSESGTVGKSENDKESNIEGSENDTNSGSKENETSLDEPLSKSTLDGMIFFCQRCDYRTYEKRSYVRHNSSAHGVGGVRYPCDQCPFETSSLDQFRKHFKNKHSVV